MNPKCRLCHSTNNDFLFYSFNTHGRHLVSKKQKFSIYRCRSCDCIFLASIKTDTNYFKKSYDKNYYVDSQKPKAIDKIWSIIAKLLVNTKISFLEKLVKHRSKIKILDIGCGNGDFLSKLPDKTFSKSGVEINRDGIDRCRRKGIRVYEKSLEKIDFGSTKFDLITMWHVFEHLDKPIANLKKIRQILSKNGILVIQVPNSRSLGFTIGKQNWFHLDSPRHLLIPSKESMEKVLQKTGFRLTKIKNHYFDYPLDLFWSIRSSKLKYLIYPIYPIIKILSQEHLTYIATQSKYGKS